MRRALGVALLALAGCRRIDAGPVDAAPLAAAQVIFDPQVYPILARKCGDARCHGDATFERVPARFVATDPRLGWFTASRFHSLTGPFMSGQAPVLKRIANGHHDVTYAPDELAAIEHWMNIELAIRTRFPVEVAAGFSALADDALARFRGCMTFEDFDAANMTRWANVETDDAQRCAACHATGAGGFIATGGAFEMYDAIYRSESRFLQYFTLQPITASQVEVIINFDSFTLVSSGDDPHRTHPRFDPFTNAGFAALQQLEQATQRRRDSGDCGAPAPFPAAKAPDG